MYTLKEEILPEENFAVSFLKPQNKLQQNLSKSIDHKIKFPQKFLPLR